MCSQILIISIIITLFSCKKELESASINAPIRSSNSTSHYSFEYVMPLDLNLYIQCTDESAHFTGELVGRVRLSETTDGPRYHFHGNSMWRYRNMKGVGIATGNKYSIISLRVDLANYRNGESEPFAAHVRETLRITTPNNGNNYVMEIEVRLVRNANGEIKID